VTVVVLKAKNLPKFDVSGLADPYVKVRHSSRLSQVHKCVQVYMLYNGQKLAKKKTHIKKRTLTPVYNESFIFDLPSADPAALDDVSFEFAIMDWDRVTRNEVMGRCVLGVRAPTDTGRSHWEQVRTVAPVS
jgi:Ca2+-dependent lipid-binding protein